MFALFALTKSLPTQKRKISKFTSQTSSLLSLFSFLQTSTTAIRKESLLQCRGLVSFADCLSLLSYGMFSSLTPLPVISSLFFLDESLPKLRSRRSIFYEPLNNMHHHLIHISHFTSVHMIFFLMEWDIVC